MKIVGFLNYYLKLIGLSKIDNSFKFIKEKIFLFNKIEIFAKIIDGIKIVYKIFGIPIIKIRKKQSGRYVKFCGIPILKITP
jgi:hypothetical protein